MLTRKTTGHHGPCVQEHRGGWGSRGRGCRGEGGSPRQMELHSTVRDPEDRGAEMWASLEGQRACCIERVIFIFIISAWRDGRREVWY